MELIRFGSDAIQMEVLPSVGGRIHRLRAFGHDLLRTPASAADHEREPFYWGCYPMLPWCNRLPGGRIHIDGRTVTMPTNLDGFSIHGEAYARPWDVSEATDSSVTMTFQGGSFDFPWAYIGEQHLIADGSEIAVTVRLTNLSDEVMPAGIGLHPWFATGTELHATLPCELVIPTTDCLPTGEPRPVSGVFDLRELTPVPWGLDDVWTGLTGRTIQLDWPSRHLLAAYRFGTAATVIVLAAFEPLQAVAIEPITHVPGEPGRLDPGATLALEHVLTVSRG